MTISLQVLRWDDWVYRNPADRSTTLSMQIRSWESSGGGSAGPEMDRVPGGDGQSQFGADPAGGHRFDQTMTEIAAGPALGNGNADFVGRINPATVWISLR